MEEPIVTISNGKIRGKITTNLKQNPFYSFQGIPYAKPPIGNLRFKDPEPAEPWSGVHDSTVEGSQCFAKNLGAEKPSGSEDCLFLNVYTPSIKKNDILKPVMLFIHGGSFTNGSGNSDIYGPELLLTEDIVLVTINYRLHILGFLNLKNPNLGIPGNAGLKDMVMALKWVQENITVFNGDPNNVTIFGQSSGGAACHYLILSPMAKGLFHKAILQSGCALNIWAKGTACAVAVAKELDLNTTDEEDILAYLQKIPIEELYPAAQKLNIDITASSIKPFGPVVEAKSKNAFLSEEPLELLRTGRYNHVPIILGYTSREGLWAEILQRPYKPLIDFELEVPRFLKLKRNSDISKLVAQQIKEFYYGVEEPSEKNKDNSFLLLSDNFIIRELIRSVRYHTETSSNAVFLYRMSIETRLNMPKILHGIEEPGVCHADDLGYLFKNLLTSEIEENSEEDIAIQRFVKLWTNFAKYGDPNPREKSYLINVKWTPATKNDIYFLDIGKELRVKVNPEAKRMAFWDEILKIKITHKL